MTPVTPPTDLAGETPAARCPYCERPFRSERARALHVGEDHAGIATDAEVDAYDAAVEAEAEELFFYHLKVVGLLGLIYGGTAILYMVALGSGLL